MSEYGDCVVLKLMNGDQCMGRFLREEDDHIMFEDLVMVKSISIPTQHGTVEKTITSPYCPVAEDTIYRFDKRHVLFVKALDATVAKMYKQMVKQFRHEAPTEFDPDDVLGEREEEPVDGFLIVPDADDVKIH